MPDSKPYPDLRVEVAFLERWAAENGCRFNPEGEVGFGRECVGITTGSEYPAYEAYDSDLNLTHVCSEASPPAGVPNAYHKHPCLAVLGQGPEAIHELYIWVQHLAEQGIKVENRARQGRPIDRLFHGPEEALLVKGDVRD